MTPDSAAPRPAESALIDAASPVYTAMQRYYAELSAGVADWVISRKTPAQERVLRSAVDAYRRTDCHTAAEVFTLATDIDNLSELAFFGAGLASFELNRMGVARANFAQARTLHDMIGTKRHLDLYDNVIAGLAAAPPGGVKDDEPAPMFAARDEQQRWYMRYARHHPKRIALKSVADFDTYFLDGLTPPAPIIGAADRIATIGSCFAENLSRALARDTDGHLPLDDSFFTTYVLREAFEYAFGGEEARAHWYRDGAANRPEQGAGYSVDQVRAAFGQGDAYIVTLGLAEIWYNRKTNAVYPSGVNIAAFDPAEHGFRVSTVDENLANIETTLDLIRRNRGAVPVIFTLSPVPLAATFRDFNCVAANSVSKAILRLAIDRLIESHRDDPNLFYFPAYEIVRDYFVDPFMPDMRHVKSDVVDFVIDQFRRKFIGAGS